MVTDPVCLRQLDEQKTELKAVFRGKTYFFHSQRCRAAFEQAPEEYTGRIERIVYGD